MASRRQRDREEIRQFEAEASGESLFADALADVAEDPHLENRNILGRATKNSFIFIAMLRARKFPLSAGDRLYVNIGLSGTQKERDYAVIRDDLQLETPSGVRDSLTSAEIDFHTPGRRTENADPWQRFKIKRPDGKYTALNDLLIEHYMDLNVDVETLVNRDALAALLMKRRQVPGPYQEGARKALKRIDAAAKKAAKLATNTETNSSTEGSSNDAAAHR